MRLVHSLDDGGCYFERDDWVVSILYPTRAAAEQARRREEIVWEDTESGAPSRERDE